LAQVTLSAGRQAAKVALCASTLPCGFGRPQRLFNQTLALLQPPRRQQSVLIEKVERAREIGQSVANPFMPAKSFN
jgi:hypothetical protein